MRLLAGGLYVGIHGFLVLMVIDLGGANVVFERIIGMAVGSILYPHCRNPHPRFGKASGLHGVNGFTQYQRAKEP